MDNPFLSPDGPSEWESQFDLSSTSGLICEVCHALVPRMEKHAKAHLEWHKSVHGS